MEMKPYIVYVKHNSNGYITAVNSSAFLADTINWVEINSGFGDKYHILRHHLKRWCSFYLIFLKFCDIIYIQR